MIIDDDEILEEESQEKEEEILEEESQEEDDDEIKKANFTINEVKNALADVGKFLLPYFISYRSKLLPFVIGIIVETTYNVVFPLCLKYLIDDALYEQNHQALLWIIAILTISGITVSLVSVWYEYQNAHLGAAIIKDIRQDLFDHLQKLSIDFYSKFKVGNILSRFSSDLAKVQEIVMEGVWRGVRPFLEIIFAIGLMFYLKWQLALIAMLIWPLILLGPRFFAERMIRESYHNSQQQASTLSVVQENVTAQLLVKAFNLQSVSRHWFKRRNSKLAESDISVRFLYAILERLINTLVLLLHLLVLSFGAYLAFQKQITVGTLVSFENVFWELSYSLLAFIDFIPLLINVSGRIQHINDIFSLKPSIIDAHGAFNLSPLEKEIVFEKVCFSYTEEEQQLKNLSFKIPCGSHVAIIGPSGSGKSTILSLLLRLYDPDSGSIKIDGYDLRNVTLESLRLQIAVVFQENILFNISLRENIRLGNLEATDKEIEEAARSAEIHDFILSLPLGYDTVVSERGGSLSGGQRQRIAIARAIVRHPAILILDEATSALDAVTEASILTTLDQIAKTCTVISITHRLSSLLNADCIFVLNKGELIETGTHQHLLKQDGLYSHIWQKSI